MESHGGYLCRLESVGTKTLVEIAKRALPLDGRRPADCSLLVSVMAEKKILRVGYDAPFTYGSRGACWYETHHAFARLLSREAQTSVHAYVIDPDEFEMVMTYGGGREVGGERVSYEAVELPDEENEAAFERLKSRWPLGHLAKIFGVTRNELVRMPRAPSVLLNLEDASPPHVANLFAMKRSRALGT